MLCVESCYCRSAMLGVASISLSVPSSLQPHSRHNCGAVGTGNRWGVSRSMYESLVWCVCVGVPNASRPISKSLPTSPFLAGCCRARASLESQPSSSFGCSARRYSSIVPLAHTSRPRDEAASHFVDAAVLR